MKLGLEVIAMLIILAIVTFVFGVWTFVLWPRTGGAPGAAGRAPRSKDEASGRAAAEPAPRTLEGVLVAQLASGQISISTCTRWKVSHAMEGLAARDDEHHPLSVPPGADSADA